MEEVAEEQKKEKKMDSVMASWLSSDGGDNLHGDGKKLKLGP